MGLATEIRCCSLGTSRVYLLLAHSLTGTIPGLGYPAASHHLATARTASTSRSLNGRNIFYAISELLPLAQPTQRHMSLTAQHPNTPTKSNVNVKHERAHTLERVCITVVESQRFESNPDGSIPTSTLCYVPHYEYLNPRRSSRNREVVVLVAVSSLASQIIERTNQRSRQ